VFVAVLASSTVLDVKEYRRWSWMLVMRALGVVVRRASQSL
jgi:hypothetical protein